MNQGRRHVRPVNQFPGLGLALVVDAHGAANAALPGEEAKERQDLELQETAPGFPAQGISGTAFTANHGGPFDDVEEQNQSASPYPGDGSGRRCDSKSLRTVFALRNNVRSKRVGQDVTAVTNSSDFGPIADWVPRWAQAEVAFRVALGRRR